MCIQIRDNGWLNRSINNYSVTPGQTITVVVGSGGSGYNNSSSIGGGASGAVRIVWPGSLRQFPNTNVTVSGNEVYN